MNLCKKLVLVSLCLFCLAGTAQADFLSGLVGYWGFDSSLADYTTNHNGTWVGGTETYAAGKFGSAINLKYSLAQYVTLGGNVYDTAPGFSPAGVDQGDTTHNMTLSLWFTTRSFASAWECLAGKGEGAQWRFGRYSGGTQMSWGGSESPFDPPTGAWTDGAWRHLVYIWQDNPGTSDQRIVYVDGVKMKDIVINLAGYTNSPTNVPQIGGNPGAAGRSWDGMIDDVGYWNRALSETEVLAMYNGGTGASIGSLLPEPSSFVLLLAGLVGLLAYGWRKRK